MHKNKSAFHLRKITLVYLLKMDLLSVTMMSNDTLISLPVVEWKEGQARGLDEANK